MKQIQSLLSSEYIAAHIQNGLVVDIIQSQSQSQSSHSQQHDQPNAMQGSHNIYNSSDGIDSNGSPLEMTPERHYIAAQDVSTIPMESIQHALHHSNHQNSIHHHQNHRDHHNHHHFEQDIVDRKVIMGDSGRQYILTNEAPVIVSNKEVAAAAMTMNDLDLSNSFPSTFSQMDHTVLQEITKTSPSRMDDPHDLDTENQVSANNNSFG